MGEICVLTSSMYNSTVTDTMYFIALYAVPVTVMLMIYLRIGVHMKKSEKIRKDLSGNKFRPTVLLQSDKGSCQMGNFDTASATTMSTTSLVSKSSSSTGLTFYGQMLPLNSLVKVCSSFLKSKNCREQLTYLCLF